MFKKLVAIEPVSLIPTAEEALHQYAEQVELYRDIPADDEEIVRRIGDAEAAGMKYKPLDALLRESEVVFTCLNKNVLLLGEPEFEALGEGKVLFNTSIGPGFDSAALEKWLDKPGTHFFCDTYAAAGPVSEGFFRRPNVHSPGVSAGRTRQAFVLLSKKVLANIETALGE